MKRLLLPGLALASFLLCWFLSANRQDPASEPARNPLQTAVPAVRKSADVSPPGQFVQDMERSLEAFVRGENGPFSGERLMEMCAAVRNGDGCAFAPIYLYARRWALADPAGMYAWFKSRGDFSVLASRDGGNFGFGFSGVIFTAWAEKDAGAALACAEKHTGPERVEGIGAIITSLLRTDPARAREIAAKHLALLARQSQMWLPQKTAGVWEMLTALPAGADRGRMAAVWLRGQVDALTTSAEDVQNLWTTAPPELRQDLAAAGFTVREVDEFSPGTMLKPNPPPAASAKLEGLEDMARTHAEQSGDPQAATGFLRTHGKAWAARDPAAAVQWAQGHLRGRERVNETVRLFTGAAENFEAAAAAWQALPEGLLKARAAGALAAAAAPEHRPAAEVLLNSLSPADRKAAEPQREERSAGNAVPDPPDQPPAG